MNKPRVAVVRYESPFVSVRKAIDLCGGLDHMLHWREGLYQAKHRFLD